MDFWNQSSCKIEINIDQHCNWEIAINGKEIVAPKRFAIDLKDGEKPTSYLLEYYSLFSQDLNKSVHAQRTFGRPENGGTPPVVQDTSK